MGIKKINQAWQYAIEGFKSFIGYEYNMIKIVFEYGGDEIVFINEGWIGRVRIYLNGQLAYRGWDFTLLLRSSGWFLHNKKTYLIKSKATNFLTLAQHLTMFVDDEPVVDKTDAMFGKLKPYEILHMLGGSFCVGLLFGFLAKGLGV